jgi:hypothetical protein
MAKLIECVKRKYDDLLNLEHPFRDTFIQAVIVAGLLCIQIPLWVRFLTENKRIPLDALNTAGYCSDVFMVILAIFVFVALRANAWIIFGIFATAVIALVGTFAWIYWINGTRQNFGISLSHLDAVYFVLGTLTTGTGNISAITELSRAIQTAQIVCDFALLVFGAGVVVSRLAR